MKGGKKRKPDMNVTDLGFGEALARFIGTDPKELQAPTPGDILREREKIRKRIESTEREIEDGARPKRGRFRL